MFEMAAGYELTHLRPSEADYKNVDKSVKPILEHIFEEKFPNDVDNVSRLMTSLDDRCYCCFIAADI